MIEDAALRELFKAESEEHLQRLDDALLQLEKTPSDQPLLEEAFREAHSLKGAARMLGLTAIQTPAHRLEDQFNAARRNTTPINAQSLAQMALALTEIRALTQQALVNGEAMERAASPMPAPAVRVAAAPAPARPPVTPANAPTSSSRPALAPDVPASADIDFAPAQSLPAVPYQIESVRVDTKRLDVLMTHASELAVTRTRFAQRLADVDALIDLNEEGSRSLAGQTSPVARQQHSQLDAMLSRFRSEFSQDSARLHTIADELDSGIRRIRLLPLSNVFKLFPRLVHDLGQEQGKVVELTLEGEETNADKRILEEIKDPLMHVLRNAVDHGIEPPEDRVRAGKPEVGAIRIKASQNADRVVIEISDDGRGLDAAAIKRAALKRNLFSQETLDAMSMEQIHWLIFAAGMSTANYVTELSGRGVGMSVVNANVQRLKGSIQLVSTPGQGTHITLTLPLTLSTVHVLLVSVNGHAYGLPLECVRALRSVKAQDIFTLEGHRSILHQGQPILAARLGDLLELGQPNSLALSNCVVFCVGSECFALFVDDLLGDQEVMLKAQSALLERVRNVTGATVLANGEICMVLNMQDLVASLRKGTAASALAQSVLVASEQRKTILLAEDSLVMRSQETRILEGAGYEVVAAVDGMQAWDMMATRVFDAVITDVMMPKLDGLSLARRIRSETRYAELPIILVTALSSDEDKRRGFDVGADAYLTKSAFDQQVLLDCLQRLIQ